MNRREILSLLGAGAAAGISGCTSELNELVETCGSSDEVEIYEGDRVEVGQAYFSLRDGKMEMYDSQDNLYLKAAEGARISPGIHMDSAGSIPKVELESDNRYYLDFDQEVEYCRM